MSKWTPRVAFLLAFAAGNFVYQAFSGHDWPLALDRSIFQCVAVLAWWYSEWIGQKS